MQRGKYSVRTAGETALTRDGQSNRTEQARPFLKWAGGKQQLLRQYEEYFPKHFNRYFEPFLGGGAVFFHLWNAGKLCGRSYLFDNNHELVNTYVVVRDKIEQLMEALALHAGNHSKAYYYQIRNLDRERVRLSDVERAARMIYLNKTCYNGLYRVNRKGHFNVPIGSYVKPKILDESCLWAAHAALQGVVIEPRDFRAVRQLAKPGDFVYMDPPYHPLSRTASFTGYTAGQFKEEDQKGLAMVFEELTERGCLCMLSNSHTPLILDLYRDFRIEVVEAARAINCNGQRRRGIREVVVLNY